MRNARHDVGFALNGQRTIDGSSLGVGVRLERVATTYRTGIGADSGASIDARQLLGTAFVQYEASIVRRVTVATGVSLAQLGTRAYGSSQAELRWRASNVVSFSAGIVQQHQFVQSLRNEESIAGNVFPADLFIAADARTVPVARSTQGVLSARYHPHPGVRLNAVAYVRRVKDVLMVAPDDGAPFAVRAFSLGEGASRGMALDAAISTARVGLTANYGFQRVQLASSRNTYVPTYGDVHVLSTGVIVFPTPTLSVRLGLSGSAGRRTSNVVGSFEWESCNLRDRGCEFGGSPLTDPSALGLTRLPVYARADVGVRKHWHLHTGARDLGGGFGFEETVLRVRIRQVL